jgi:hypothetical protein
MTARACGAPWPRQAVARLSAPYSVAAAFDQQTGLRLDAAVAQQAGCGSAAIRLRDNGVGRKFGNRLSSTSLAQPRID